MAAKDRKGLLIDYYYCTGCRSCEVACAVEHALPLGEFGIKVQEVGPWEYAKGSRGGDQKNWQLSYIPVPTDQCDLCAERVQMGKQPSCVHNCQADCMRYGTMEELAEYMGDNPKQVMWFPE